MCGLVFSGVVAKVVRDQERERFESEFERQAQIQTRAMEVAVHGFEECLFALRVLFDSSDDVRVEEFRRAAADLRARHPGIELLAWMPRVAREERAAFEAGAMREDGTKFFIHENAEGSATDALAPVPVGDEYLPVQYCDPMRGNEAIFGSDQFRGPYRETNVRSIESGDVAATQRVTLGENEGAEPGWAFALAVYRGDPAPQTAEERRSRLRGVLAAAVPFSDLLANTVEKMPKNSLDLVLLDESAEGGAGYLAGLVGGKLRMSETPADGDFRAGLFRALPLPVAGRNWVALFRPSGKPVFIYPGAFLAGGILLTGLLMLLLDSAQRRTLEVQRVVGERTAELHKTQLALHEDNQRRRSAEERYRAFVEQSSEAIWRFELSEAVAVDLPVEEQVELYYGRAFLAEANDAFAQMYGYERAKEMIGMSLADLMPRDPATFAHLREYVRSGYRLANAESHEVARDGKRRVFLNNLTGIVENGKMVRAWGTQRDVTEQRRAEEERRRAEVRLRSALAAADLGTWEWDPVADTITWSETTERMFGFEPGTFRGGLAEYLALVHPDHRALTEARLQQVRAWAGASRANSASCGAMGRCAGSRRAAMSSAMNADASSGSSARRWM